MWFTICLQYVLWLVFTYNLLLPTQAYSTVKGNLVKNSTVQRMDYLSPYFTLSFVINVLEKPTKRRSVIHITEKDNLASYRGRIVEIYLEGNNLNVKFAINKEGAAFAFEINAYEYVRIEVSQQQVDKGELVFSVSVKGETSNRTNHLPEYFRDVTVYQSNPWDEPANAIVDEFHFEDHELNAIPCMKPWLQKKDLLLPYYEFSFDIKPYGKNIDGNSSIIHVATESTTGKCGKQVLEFSFMAGSTNLRVCSPAINGIYLFENNCWISEEPLIRHEYTNIQVVQNIGDDGDVRFVVRVGNNEVYNGVNSKPILFEDVIVYTVGSNNDVSFAAGTSKNVMHPAEAILKNIELKNLTYGDDSFNLFDVFRWNSWTNCSRTNGKCIRRRSFNNQITIKTTTGAATADSCRDNEYQLELCCDNECPGVWSEWSQCGATDVCSKGHRNRNCEGPGECVGPSLEQCTYESVCETTSVAPTNGGLSCSSICEGQGKMCDPYLPIGNSMSIFQLNGLNCTSDGQGTQASYQNQYDPHYDSQTNSCIGYMNVPVKINCSAVPPSNTTVRVCRCIDKGDENSIPWMQWSDCSATCRGVRERWRSCKINSVGTCPKNVYEQQNCSGDCPVHGGFTEWTSWSACSATCGTGTRQQIRTCTNPIPTNGGLDCVGNKTKNETCGSNYCPVDGGWSEWSDWTTGCSKPCNGGERVRKRFCTNPRPRFQGSYCHGNASETMKCNEQECENVKVEVICRFNEEFQGNEWRDQKKFESRLERDLHELYSWEAENNNDFNGTLKNVEVKNLRNGSIIAEFVLEFYHLDSYQLVYLQDSLQVDGAIGKKEVIMDDVNTLSSTQVPSSGPVNVTAIADSATSINVTWDEIPEEKQNGVLGYLVYYRPHGQTSETYQVLSTNYTNAQMIGLHAYTKYNIRILGYNAIGNGIATNPFYCTTKELPPSDAPSEVEAIVISSFSIYVSWNHIRYEDMNGELLGYRVMYWAQSDSNNIMNVSVTYPNASSLLTDLNDQETYTIHVSAFNSAGNGPSQKTEARTNPHIPEQVAYSEAPYNVTITSRSHNALSIKWNDILTSDQQASNDEILGYIVSIVLVETDSVTKIGHPVVETNLPTQAFSHDFKLLQTNSKYRIGVMAIKKYGANYMAFLEAETCKCEKEIFTNYYENSPYVEAKGANGIPTGIFGVLLEDLIVQTCGECDQVISNYTTTINFNQNGKNQFAIKRNMDRVLDDIDDSTHLSFPLSGLPASKESGNVVFLRITEYPGAIFIIRKPTSSEHVKKLVGEIVNVVPLLFIDFVMIVLAGMVMWGLERYTWNTPTSKNSVKSIKEAWYWAYITQTTIGYGDFYPVSKKARLFAIVWMVVSLVLSSLITGALTTAFTATNSIDTKIYGRDVAALNNTFEARLAVLRNGNVDKDDVYQSVEDLVNALVSKRLDGILLETSVAASKRQLILQNNLDPINLIKYPRHMGAVLSGPLANIANVLADNMKAKEAEIIKLFNEEIELLLPASKHKATSLFDIDSPSLMKSIIILLIMLALGMMFGIIFWWVRRGKIKNVTIQPEDPCIDTAFPIKPLWREVIKFRYYFITRTCKLYQRIEQERLQLYYDRGASSLRNNNFSLYSRQKPSSSTRRRKASDVIRDAVRKISTFSIGHSYNSFHDVGATINEEREVTKSLASTTSLASSIPNVDEEFQRTKNNDIAIDMDEYDRGSEDSELEEEIWNTTERASIRSYGSSDGDVEDSSDEEDV